jgi:hypothetical protein
VAGLAVDGVIESVAPRRRRRAFHYNAAMADRLDPGKAEDPARTRTYASVLFVQAVVLLVLWATGRYFGTP